MSIFSFLCCLRNSHHDSHSNGAAGGSAKSGAARASAPEPYSDAHAKQLFATYQDPDTPGEIGPEGFEKLCTDLDISLEGALPLVLAWQLNGSEMAKFTEEEWVKGTSELRYVLADLTACADTHGLA